MKRSTLVVAGLGAIAFGLLTFIAIFWADWPGGNYDASTVRAYVTAGHLPIALAGTLLGLIAVTGLICLFTYLRQAVDLAAPSISVLPEIVWALGLVGAACFAIGWGLVSAQPLAHVEAGVDLAVPPTLTYMISESTSAIIFGPAPMLVGFALIALGIGSSRAFPGWLRWSTLVIGVLAVTSLAFFTFFLLLIWSVVVGLWLLLRARVP